MGAAAGWYGTNEFPGAMALSATADGRHVPFCVSTRRDNRRPLVLIEPGEFTRGI